MHYGRTNIALALMLLASLISGCDTDPSGKTLEEFFGSRAKIERQGNRINLTVNEISTGETWVTGAGNDIDKAGRWLKLNSGEAAEVVALKINFNMVSNDKYGNQRHWTEYGAELTAETSELRKINYESVYKIHDFIKVVELKPLSIRGALDWCGTTNILGVEFCGRIRRYVAGQR